jgi:hypothetical protein
MKEQLTIHFIIVTIFVLLFPYLIKAQENTGDVNFRSDLASLIQLNIAPDVYLEFGINEINDKLYQITKYPDDLIFSVESTENWTLSIASTSSYFRGVKDSTLTIPVDFIGFTVENHGNNFDNGLFSNIYNVTKDTILELSSEKKMIMTNGRRHNIGNAKDNYFILRWKFLYQDDPLRMREFYNFRMANDLFRVGVSLTLTKSLDPVQPDKGKVTKKQ